MLDFGYGGSGSGSGDEHDQASNGGRGKKHYHRHTAYQIQQLEGFFKDCPHPDENQRRQLSRDLGLAPKQIKFWFQNKRTQTKAQNERADNNALKVENEKIQCENLAIREALKNVVCPACGGCPPHGEEERQLTLQKLRMENTQLKQEYERLTHLLGNFNGRPATQIQTPLMSSSDHLQTEAGLQGQGGGGLMGEPNSVVDVGAGNSRNIPTMMPPPPHHLIVNGIDQEMERSVMIDSAVGAMGELLRLLRVNEPVWVKSPIDGKYTLHRDSYNKLFPRHNHFRTSADARIDSSKDSGVVAMSAMQLIDVFMDTNKWLDFFPTIVTKARTIEVVDTKILGDQGGFLQLMYEDMHILSALVAAREYYFLRYCREVEAGVWVMVDVSYDCPREGTQASPLRSWRLPSGCLIQEKSNGFSEVTWVEHVEVDDKSLTHPLYRDLICNCSAAYGAQRWIVTLQRMSERLAYSTGAGSPSHELGEAKELGEGRKSIMELSGRMVKNFWRMLSMSPGGGKVEFPTPPQMASEMNDSGVRVCVRPISNEEEGAGLLQPTGMIVSAASSLWLPLSSHSLFDFFRDHKTRSQWDVLYNGNPVTEIAHISCGTHPGNCISIFQPFLPKDNNVLMIQESIIDPLGSMVVYAPVDVPHIKSATTGEDSANIPLIPSGFIISGDGRPNGASTSSTSGTKRSSSSSGGSLLTVAFQIVVCSGLSQSKQTNMESVATANTLVTSTVQKIKVALDCSNLD